MTKSSAQTESAAKKRSPSASAKTAQTKQPAASGNVSSTAKTAGKIAAQSPVAPKKPRVSALAQQALDAAKSKGRERPFDGARLVKLIQKTLIDRDLPDRSIADVMGVTQVYWNALANGNRQIKSLGKDKLQKIAEFLNIPLVQVYVLADHLTAEDFFTSKTLDEQLWLSLRKMQEDPQWGAYAPSEEEWEQTPLSVKTTFVTLYERETKRFLLAKAAVELPDAHFKG